MFSLQFLKLVNKLAAKQPVRSSPPAALHPQSLNPPNTVQSKKIRIPAIAMQPLTPSGVAELMEHVNPLEPEESQYDDTQDGRRYI